MQPSTAADRRKRVEPYTTAVAATTVVMATSVAGLLLHRQLPVSVSARSWVLVASSCFVFIGWLSWTALRGPTSFRMLLGLIACWLGDYLGLQNFTSGAISFLIAHLFFISAWARQGIVWRRVPAVLAAVTAAAGGSAAWLWPHVPRGDLPLVLGYLAAISAMVVTAGSVDLPRWPFTFAAAAIFFASDMAVARGQFVAPGDMNAWFCYPLYYTSCLMLAVSPLVTRKRYPRITAGPLGKGRIA